ncbi:NAD(P)H-binding protein [Nocardia sp. SYP-A9097]|uniref:NAD(P)H-binding protein n=1 Tax=Nocardia sp. SYP-A9097 TaxID=2663237 RepID=UPI00129B4BA9|nr:NAD(P)H-binding protein [Nocardia sp. SYP-A9097]MRH93379.1 NAD(P)H-binding protein [Nocardia sp. SYP-A9097]
MILLTGATGNIGSELTRQLATAAVPYRALVRDPSRVADLPGAELHKGDLDDPATLTAAFDGITALFLLVPGTGMDHTRHAVAAARAAGVERIVLISSFWAIGDPIPAMGRWHHKREQLVLNSGLAATILRPGGLMTNALEWAPAIRAGEPILDPTGPGRFAPIDPADIAAVALLALTEDGHKGAAYNLTGAESLTCAEQVGILARVLDRPLPIRSTATAEEAVRARFPRGAHPQLAEAIRESFAQMRSDTVGLRTDTVAELLGRAPRTFEDWCRAHRDAFR